MINKKNIFKFLQYMSQRLKKDPSKRLLSKPIFLLITISNYDTNDRKSLQYINIWIVFWSMWINLVNNLCERFESFVWGKDIL